MRDRAFCTRTSLEVDSERKETYIRRYGVGPGLFERNTGQFIDFTCSVVYGVVPFIFSAV